MRTRVPLAVGLSGLLILASGCSSSKSHADAPQPRSVSGQIVISGVSHITFTVIDRNAVCLGSGSLTHVRTNADLTVKDQAGKIVATTTLGPGVSTEGAVKRCALPFSFSARPADFYTLEVGGVSKTFSSDDVASPVLWRL